MSTKHNLQRLSSINIGPWTHIVPGRWSSSQYDGLLMYNQAAGSAAFYNTDGQGNLVFPPLQQGNNWRTSWSQVISGRFDDSGFSGVFFYDPIDGTAHLFATDGAANISEQAQWNTRKTWTHIVPGFFTNDNYTSFLFYSQTEGYAELWRTNGALPYQPNLINSFPYYLTSWTKIIPGKFCPQPPGTPEGTPIYTDLLFYDANGYSQWWASTGTDFYQITAQNNQQTLPASTSIAAGNFGGWGYTDILLHENATGALSFQALYSTFSGSINLSAFSELDNVAIGDSGIPLTVDILASGHFWLSNPDDQCFHDGPADYQPGDGAAERRNWKIDPGPFLDLLFYDRAAGLLNIYSHLPLPAPASPAIEGYITSTSDHGGRRLSSGSVLAGESVSVHISSPHSYSIQVIRAWELAQPHPPILFQGATLPANAPQPISLTAFRDGANWPSVQTIEIPTTWSSDLYVVRVTEQLAPKDFHTNVIDLPFVVRPSAPDAGTVLIIVPDANDEAYNGWGGRSLYTYQTSTGIDDTPVYVWPVGVRAPQALKVHFDRPYKNHFFLQRDSKWSLRVAPLLQWLNGFGIGYDVITERDLDVSPISTKYRLAVFPGHHEYWSSNMRSNATAFVNEGGNVAYLCANTCWWQVRFTSDYAGMYCYKQKGFDPLLHANPGLVTVNWFDVPLSNPESLMTGLTWGADGGGIVINDAVSTFSPGNPAGYNPLNFAVNPGKASHWLLSNTELADGSVFGLCPFGSVLGTELDHMQLTSHGKPLVPFDALASSVAASDGDGGSIPQGAASLGYFQPHGARGTVFNAGVIDWTMGLTKDPNHLYADWLPMDQITLNVVTGLQGAPTAMPGNGIDVGVGSNGTVYSITASQAIQYWTGSTWVAIPGYAVRVAVDSDGHPWVINGSSEIYRWVNGAFRQVSGAAFDIGIGGPDGGAVWVIGTDYHPYRWNGSAFVGIDGIGSRIAVDGSGSPWIVNSSGDLYRRVGGIGGSWALIQTGCATDVGIGANGAVWITGASSLSGRVYRCYSGGSAVWPRFGSLPVGGVSIAVAPDGTPWFTDASNQIMKFS